MKPQRKGYFLAMDLTNITQDEKAILQILWELDGVEIRKLTALCKERLGWSSATIRRLLRNLKRRNAVVITHGTATALVTKDQLEAADWNNWIEDAFDLPSVTNSAPKPRRVVSRKLWLAAVLAAVLAIAVIAILCLPAPLPAELEPCKAALDQWQSSESSHITLSYIRSGQAYNVEAAADAVDYWRSGNNWLRIAYFSSEGVGTPGYMYRDGIAYYNVATEQGMLWVPDAFPQLNAADIWPLTFTWDHCEFTGISIEEVEDRKQITFSVVKDSSDQPSAKDVPYYVCFYFDQNEQLESVSVTTVNAGPYVTICTYRLLSTDAAEISKHIHDQKIDTTDNK